MRRGSIVAIALLFCCSHAFAWGTKEHIQLTRIAVERLIANPDTPAEMKAWLKSAAPGLLDPQAEKEWFLKERIGMIGRGADGITFWAVMPDTTIFMDLRKEKVEPFGVTEGLLHYIDLEFFVADDSKRAYKHDLSGKPKLEDVPRDMKDPRWQRAGMLPFRVQDCYEKLVKSLRENRLTDAPGQYPKDEHAGKWAGYLSHYLEDNTQPQHATADFKSAVYFAQKSAAPNVHAQVEYVMCDDEADDHMALREEYWPMFEKTLEGFADPIKTDDPWQATVEVSITSYDALPMIGVAAMAATGQGGTPEKPEGAAHEFNTETFFHAKGQYLGREMTVMEMKAYQQAWAVKRVERMLRKAWDEGRAAK